MAVFDGAILERIAGTRCGFFYGYRWHNAACPDMEAPRESSRPAGNERRKLFVGNANARAERAF